ncbi:hypothetical protein MKEN_01165500 [Mycena kentingensis (nom. inval.)]|nr:hypothetical protein MKEN_01165500 [Mycena kentingensis (nom. inval.)]
MDQSNTDELTRVPELWFPDCNLVIQAGSDLFRVSGHFLAQHSPVFADMLQICSGNATPMENYHGCPLLRLPDAADDVYHFLKALLYYDYFEPVPAETTWSIHCANGPSATSRCLPTTLADWDALYESDVTTLFLELREDLPAALILIRQLSLDWLLPTLFYHLCTFSDEEIVVNSEISNADKTLWASGIRALAVANGPLLEFLWTSAAVDGCSNPRLCYAHRLNARRTAEEWRGEGDPDENCQWPLAIWDQDDWQRLDDGVCEGCMQWMKKTHKEAREKFWNRLPTIFKLPDWETLEAMKEEALRPATTV